MDLESGIQKLKRIERDTLFITLGFALLSRIITGSWMSMLSLMLGGGLMLANFHYLWRFARRLFLEENLKKVAFLSGIFFFFFLFLGSVAFAILYLKVPIVPFFVGTLALLISIFLNGVIFA